jgi:outer membrane protein
MPVPAWPYGASGAAGHSRTRDASATLTQTVLDFSQYANLKAAHSASNAQDETYEAAAQNLYVRVATAYFAILTDEDQLTFAQANEDASSGSTNRPRHSSMWVSGGDHRVYQAKAFYDNAKTQTVTAQNTVNNDKEALRVITGQPTGDLKKLRDDLPMQAPSPNDPDTWVKQALELNPSLLAQQYNVQTAEHNISAARAGHLPTITASVNYGKNSTWFQNDNASGETTPASTTIGLTLDRADLLRRPHAVARASVD